MLALATPLHHNTTLQEIELYGNQSGIDGAKELVNALQHQ